jgi:hypothetical protein
MKKIASLFAVVATFWVASPVLKADGSVTSSGTLGVTATVDPCISLTFVSHGSAIALGSSGTSAATLGFGTVGAYIANPTSGVTQALVGGSGYSATAFSLTTSFDVQVLASNTGSVNYSLSAALNTADAVNAWTLNSVALTTTPQQVVATGSYTAVTNLPFVLQIPFTENTGVGSTVSISNQVNFVATAN